MAVARESSSSRELYTCMLARTVLRRWNITSTLDFGRMVFAMVDGGLMQKTEEDSVEDFRNVYDFRNAFESDYHIPCPAL